MTTQQRLMNKITLKDTYTGAVSTFGTEFSEFWWTEGNGACDCNRGPLFSIDAQCSDKNRFEIVSFEEWEEPNE